jgi:hypothetical protein
MKLLTRNSYRHPHVWSWLVEIYVRRMDQGAGVVGCDDADGRGGIWLGTVDGAGSVRIFIDIATLSKPDSTDQVIVIRAFAEQRTTLRHKSQVLAGSLPGVRTLCISGHTAFRSFHV